MTTLFHKATGGARTTNPSGTHEFIPSFMWCSWGSVHVFWLHIQYSQKYSMINPCDRCITLYHAIFLTVLYQYHLEEWYIYHRDLSCYISDCTVSVSLRRVIHLSQWFIMLYFWLYCILYSCCVSDYYVTRWCLSQWFIMLCPTIM
jgi:hypothetical protein